MQTEVEVLKEENAKLRRGLNTKNRNTDEVFFSA
jgi:cell shape-determining protein MreC